MQQNGGAQTILRPALHSRQLLTRSPIHIGGIVHLPGETKGKRFHAVPAKTLQPCTCRRGPLS
jgi:hypothetical protein